MHNKLVIGAFLVSVFALPFTQALTLNMGWPLKIYEIILLMLFTLCLTSPLPGCSVRKFSKEVKLLFLLVLWLVFSTGIAVLWNDCIRNAALFGPLSRFGNVGDALTKLLYFLLIAFAFSIATAFSVRYREKFISYWLWGAIVASLYGGYLFLAPFVGLPTMLLPGLERVAQIEAPVGDLMIYRMGTFLEGNFAGLYFVQSAALAFYAQRRRVGWFLCLSTLWTLSTSAIILASIVLFVDIYKRVRSIRFGMKKIAVIAISILFVSSLMYAVVTIPFLNNIVIQKIVGSEESGWGGSRAARLTQASAGIAMFEDNPIFGVGISQYGYYYNKYTGNVELEHKRIPNNVYVELLAESGIVGFALFFVFLLRMYWVSRDSNLLYLRLGFLLTLIYFIAFPTSSVMFIWYYFAFILGMHIRNQSPVLESAF